VDAIVRFDCYGVCEGMTSTVSIRSKLFPADLTLKLDSAIRQICIWVERKVVIVNIDLIMASNVCVQMSLLPEGLVTERALECFPGRVMPEDVTLHC